MSILIIEDGFEYQQTLERFLGSEFVFERAGSGPAGIERLQQGGVDAVFLDMRFDRVPDDELLGDVAAVADQFNGDPVQARLHLQDHQGTFVLAALRAAGLKVPVLLSYDFSAEPRRWSRMQAAHKPVEFLPDSAGPVEIATALRRLSSAA